jgi:hypothetical protein
LFLILIDSGNPARGTLDQIDLDGLGSIRCAAQSDAIDPAQKVSWREDRPITK